MSPLKLGLCSYILEPAVTVVEAVVGLMVMMISGGNELSLFVYSISGSAAVGDGLPFRRAYVNGPVVQVPLHQYHQLVRAATGSNLSDLSHHPHTGRMLSAPDVDNQLPVSFSCLCDLP